MNKLPSSADCLLFVWDDLSPAVEGRKSELRPVCSLVCLKIFARWVEKYFRIQCPVWWLELPGGPIIKLYQQKQICRLASSIQLRM